MLSAPIDITQPSFPEWPKLTPSLSLDITLLITIVILSSMPLTNANRASFWCILQDVKSAAEFYEGKVKDLSGNITDLETIVQNKSNTLRAVEEGEIELPVFEPKSSFIMRCANVAS